MAKLAWDKKPVSTGLDRGVIYPLDGDALAWSGLASVTESFGQESESFYLDGIRYLTIVTNTDARLSVEAYTFPDQFADLVGFPTIADGMMLDAQKPKEFNFSYRTGYIDSSHYKLHLVYGALATLSDNTHTTVNDSPEASTMSFEIIGTPQPIVGYRPSSHVTIDVSQLEEEAIAEIEGWLYGTETTDASFPELQALRDLLYFGNTIIITDIGGGFYTVRGSAQHVTTTDDRFDVENLTEDQYDPGPAPGTYDLTLS